MSVARAKRRLMAWERFTERTGSEPSNRMFYRHRGHLRAYGDVMYRHRWVPIGIRQPWLLTRKSGT